MAFGVGLLLVAVVGWHLQRLWRGQWQPGDLVSFLPALLDRKLVTLGLVFAISAGSQQTHLSGSGDQRTGLICQNANVVIDWVFTLSRTNGFVHLPEAEPFEGARLKPNNFIAKVGGDLGSAGK